MPQQGMAPSSQNRDNIMVGKKNYTAKQLFEVTGMIDKGAQFPEEFAFVTFVPAIQNPNSPTGFSYNQAEKINIKFSLSEVHALAESLKEGALFGRATFSKFADPNKVQGVSGEATKQVTVSAMIDQQRNNELKIFLNASYGQKKVNIVLTKQAALGLYGDLKDLCMATSIMKFEIERQKWKDSQKNIENNPSY